MGRYTLAPVSYEALDYASGFASEQCPEGFCAVARNTLRILTVERLGETFNQQVRRSPWKDYCCFVVHKVTVNTYCSCKTPSNAPQAWSRKCTF